MSNENQPSGESWFQPWRFPSKGVVISIVVLMLLALFVLWPSVDRTGPLAHRSTCAANLRGIVQSMNVYAADGDCYPIVPFAPYATVPNAAKGVSTTKDSQAGSVQGCLWIMVQSGQIAPKQFVCPEDRFADASLVAVKDKAGNPFNNFQTPKQLSYSTAYPWNVDGKPGAWSKGSTDETLPIMADMNPLQGTGTPARDMTLIVAPSNNKTWNSGNHGGEGQNVAFADGHAEFVHSPDIGQDHDNIYTMSATPSKGPAQFGGIPAGKIAPALTADKPPYDIIMLPVRNETTGGM